MRESYTYLLEVYFSLYHTYISEILCFSNSDSFKASMNLQSARNLVPVSKKFPSTAILIAMCYFSTGRRTIGRSPIVRKLENQRELGQGSPTRSPAETSHSQQNEGLGAGEWLLKNSRAFGFLSVSPQEARNIVNHFKNFDIRVRSVRDFCQGETPCVVVCGLNC